MNSTTDCLPIVRSNKRAGLSEGEWLREREILARYDTAGERLLARRTLLKRTDTKFLFNRRQLAVLLSRLSSAYGILLSTGSAWAKYCSDYFDTRDYSMYHDHRRGRRVRHKVRLRHYVDRQLTYLEVKCKTGPGVTSKRRRQLSYLTRQIEADDWAFVTDATAGRHTHLEPKLRTAYHRLTLVGLETAERITFDRALEVSSGCDTGCFGDAVIAEVKQARFSAVSPIMRALRSFGIRPSRVSKYCIGAMVLNAGIRSNRLKPSLRSLEGVDHD